jgi:hypothetical protein
MTINRITLDDTQPIAALEAIPLTGLIVRHVSGGRAHATFGLIVRETSAAVRLVWLSCRQASGGLLAGTVLPLLPAPAELAGRHCRAHSAAKRLHPSGEWEFTIGNVVYRIWDGFELSFRAELLDPSTLSPEPAEHYPAHQSLQPSRN